MKASPLCYRILRTRLRSRDLSLTSSGCRASYFCYPKYKESDLGKNQSTNFEFVDKVEGKCYITRKTNDVIAFAKSVLKQLV